MDATSVCKRTLWRHAIPLLFSICLAMTTLAWDTPSVLAAVNGREPPRLLPLEHNELVIVTTAALEPEFSRLAAHRTAGGVPARVATLEWIAALGLPGDDEPERVRNFLRIAYFEWGTRYALLGGDDEVVAPRLARNPTQWGPADFPCDLYFACLDGDWDGDGDGLYGELEDEPDVATELAVGRAPVRDLDEARVFVDKTLAYELRAGRAAQRRALMLETVIWPYPYQPGYPITDGAGYCEEQLIPRLNGASPPLAATRLYQNSVAWPGAFPLGRQAALDSMSSGRHGVVHFYGHADATRWDMGYLDLVTSADLRALTNGPEYFLMFGQAANAALFDTTSMIVEAMRNPVGGAVGGYGCVTVIFVYPMTLVQTALFQALYGDGAQRLGDALRAAQSALASEISADVYLFNLESLTLLGDPALVAGHHAPATGVDAAPSARALTLLDCRPNPFNPITRIRFALEGLADVTVPVEASLFDASGRLVARLRAGPLAPGEHELVWNGRAADGAVLPSGVYLVRVRAAGETAWGKVTLLK